MSIRRRASARAAMAAAAFVAIAAVPAFAQDRTWTDGNGVWSLAANWNPADVPDTAAENAIINNGSAVTLNGSFTIGGLTLGVANSLTTNDNTTFTINGNVSNAGTLTISSAGTRRA